MAEQNVIINVVGISCDHCANRIKTAVGNLNGVDTVNVDIDTKKVYVEFDDEKVSLETIKDIIEDQGYEIK